MEGLLAKKFVVAMMMHETNTFSPLPTPIESFARSGSLSGPMAIKDSEGTNTSLGGFIEVARKAGAEFTVPMAASAHPSGLVTKAAYEQMTAAMIEGATIITGYRTYPHIDMADTARRAGRTLLRTLDGEVEPKMVWG